MSKWKSKGKQWMRFLKRVRRKKKWSNRSQDMYSLRNLMKEQRKRRNCDDCKERGRNKGRSRGKSMWRKWNLRRKLFKEKRMLIIFSLRSITKVYICSQQMKNLTYFMRFWRNPLEFLSEYLQWTSLDHSLNSNWKILSQRFLRNFCQK